MLSIIIFTYLPQVLQNWRNSCVFDSKTSNKAPNWVTLVVTKQPIMKNLYLWLVFDNCFRILKCSSNRITSASDPNPSNYKSWSRNPSNLSIWSSQVSLNNPQTSKNIPIRYTHEANTNTNINMMEFRSRTSLVTCTCGMETTTVEKNMILCANFDKKGWQGDASEVSKGLVKLGGVHLWNVGWIFLQTIQEQELTEFVPVYKVFWKTIIKQVN